MSKIIQLDKISKDNKTLILAYDQGLEHGPTDFDDANVDPQLIMDIAKEGRYNALIFQKGIAEKYYDGSVPLIVKLNGKTSLVKGDPISPQLCSVREAVELGAKPIARLVSYATAAVDAEIMGYGETVAARMALEKAGLKIGDVQLAELNEAFACVAALATRELGIDPDIVNVNGGAVALGHPLGNTGTRMIVTLIHELQKRGQEIGLTGACVGGGQGAGSVIKVEA